MKIRRLTITLLVILALTTTVWARTVVMHDDIGVFSGPAAFGRYADLNALINAVGAITATTVVINEQLDMGAAAITITANITLDFKRLGAINAAVGQTLTFAGTTAQVSAPYDRRIFVGVGTFLFNGGVAFPDWWDAGTGVAATSLAIQASMDSGADTTKFLGHTYTYNVQLDVPDGHRLIGSGQELTWLVYTGAANAVSIDGAALRNVHIKDMHITGATSTSVIYARGIRRNFWARLWITGNPTGNGIYWDGDAANLGIYRNRISDIYIGNALNGVLVDGDAFPLSRVNANQMENVYIEPINNGVGFNIDNAQGLLLSNCTVDGPAVTNATSVLVDNAVNIILDGCWLETSGAGSLDLDTVTNAGEITLFSTRFAPARVAAGTNYVDYGQASYFKHATGIAGIMARGNIQGDANARFELNVDGAHLFRDPTIAIPDLELRRLEAGHLHLGQHINGGGTNFRAATSLQAGLVGANDTWVNGIPGGVLVLGVSARVTTLITGATGFQIGTAADPDAWANENLVAVGTTTSIGEFALPFASGATGPEYYTAGTDIVITANGPNFTGGAIRLIVYYMNFTLLTDQDVLLCQILTLGVI